MTRQDGEELLYTLQLQELRPGDFVARAASFPTMLALGDTAEEAIDRATRLLTYQLSEVRASGEPLPADVDRQLGEGQWQVLVRIAR